MYYIVYVKDWQWCYNLTELPPHAPVVVEPLTDVHGYEGSHVEVTCKISGKPVPTIHWSVEVHQHKTFKLLINILPVSYLV